MAIISPWLTHFVGHKLSTEDAQYGILLKILRDRTLGQWEQHGGVFVNPGSMLIPGTGSLCKDELIRFRPVCFCDIPADEFNRHTTIYGRFGLAFSKAFLVAQGANPVFYVAKGSLACKERPSVPHLSLEDLKANAHGAFAEHFSWMNQEEISVQRCEFFDRLVETLMKVLPPPWPSGTPADAIDPVREIQLRTQFDLLRHVFAFMKFFDESLPEENPENFYMEREWRVAGFVHFELKDIHRVYAPPGFEDRIKQEFPEVSVEHPPE